MLVEMHCHSSEHSGCSKVSAVELVQRVYAKRLQGLVLTDHHFLWSEVDLAELRRKAGMPEPFVILSGQETNVPTFGDVLIYGAPVIIPRGTSLSEIRTEYPNVAIVWAHPYRDGREPTQELLCSPLLDGIEIFNSNHTVRGNSLGLQDWRRYGFSATGGTDTHGASYAGIYPTWFKNVVGTIEELAGEIKKGNCLPYLKETSLRETDKVTEVTIGAGHHNKAPESIVIRKPADHEAWNKAERAFHVMAAIADNGFDHGIFRVPRAIDKNSEAKTLIEQGVGRESLFDKLVSATAEEKVEYLRLAGRWLARLHGLQLSITTPQEFLREEARRLSGESLRFSKTNHPYSRKVAEIAAAVQKAEEQLVETESGSLIQGHGDYHPKNIIIGQDNPNERSTLYVAAIDFERSQLMPPAFDVGWFLAQFRSQFAAYPELLASLDEEAFLAAYLTEAGPAISNGFLRQVELFRARANISIAAFLIKLGLGETGELWRTLVEAERALINFDKDSSNTES
jgi:3',5'-nucleoside bisphosphate phosphatase